MTFTVFHPDMLYIKLTWLSLFTITLLRHFGVFPFKIIDVLWNTPSALIRNIAVNPSLPVRLDTTLRFSEPVMTITLKFPLINRQNVLIK